MQSSSLNNIIGCPNYEGALQLERKNYFKSGRLRSEESAPEEALKVRSAKIGDHLNHLTQEDLDFIAQRKAHHGDPFSINTRTA